MDDHKLTARRMGRGLLTALLLAALALAPTASAQQQTLSTADRLRMLYATQLTFTAKGDPIIRLGLLEDVSTIKFTPSEAFRVMPSGEDGPVIELPGKKTYTVTISESTQGSYKHFVIVERLPVSQRERAKEIKRTWLERGYTVNTFEVGGLFAVKGKVFDSRVILFAVGGNSALRKTRKVQTKLQAKYGIEGGIHSELVEHPTGLITLTGDGVQATVRHRDILQISAMPGRDELIRYKIPGIKKNYSKGTETRTYTGTLLFSPDRGGELVLSNSLGAERALKGTVPAETYASAPMEALKAQSIAARNEIFSAIGVRNLADPYMLRADVMDQVYGGVGIEDSRTSRAVDATRGQIMFYGDQIVEAFYSSNAGGFTENNENVWDMEARPYLRGKADAPAKGVPEMFEDGVSEAELEDFLASEYGAYSQSAPVSSARMFRWEKTVSAKTAADWLADTGQKIGRVKDVEVISRGVSGRVIKIKVTGTKGSAVVQRELNVRRMFGGLRSGLFVMDIDRGTSGYIDQITFRGAGFGHGVGMCQTGAAGMASKRFKAEEILGHYYSGITIKKLY